MILTDTGPIVALGIQKDPDHLRCVQVIRTLARPLLIPLPVLTESLHLLARHGGWYAQDRLWGQVENGLVRILPLDNELLPRVRQLMAKYRDHPMDFADAALVTLAEVSGFRKVFSLDSHFRAFRLSDGSVLDVVP